MTQPGKFTVTFFDHWSARFKREADVTLAVLRETIETQKGKTKGALPWVKLAVFGNVVTKKKSLRHDANVQCVTGCEGDYDGEKIPFDDARDKLKKAGVEALLYTSPSHSPDRPRYRILCPFSERLAPDKRAQMAARLNGIFGGVLAAESFAISQSYYYGHLLDADGNIVAHKENGNGTIDVVPGECRVEVIEGQPIDQCDELDRGAIGKGGSKTNGTTYSGGDYTDIQELVRRITSGDSLHPSVGSIAGKYAKAGHPLETCVNLVGAAFALAGQGRYEGRWDECVAYIHDIYRKEEAKRSQAAPLPTTPTFDPWQRWIVPDFPLKVLPQVLQDYTTEQSTLIGCDHATMAMCALTASSAAIHHQFAVKMMRNGNWFEHPRLWTLLFGPSSYKKTPPINAVTKPIEDIQAASQKKFAEAMEEFKKLSKKEKETADEPEPPPRWLSTDSTPEKMAELLARSTKGILYKRDEFSGFVGSLDKYGGKSGSNADRAFYLKAYDGGSYTRDRVGDRNPVTSEIFVENLSVSMLSGIQPDKLAEMKGLTSDGLLQRSIPVMMRAPNLPKDVPSSAQEHFNTLINALVELQPKVLSFSDEALAVMVALRTRLHELEQASEGMVIGFSSFVGKLAGVAGRLAVILHVVAHAETNIPYCIEADVAKAVQTLVLDFILPHAIEFYQAAEGAGGERLRTIASFIITSEKNTVTARDLIQNVRPLRGVSVRDIQDAVSPLVAGGWLQPVSNAPDNRAWDVTPTVAEQFERQRQAEMARKAALGALLRRSHGK